MLGFEERYFYLLGHHNGRPNVSQMTEAVKGHRPQAGGKLPSGQSGAARAQHEAHSNG